MSHIYEGDSLLALERRCTVCKESFHIPIYNKKYNKLGRRIRSTKEGGPYYFYPKKCTICPNCNAEACIGYGVRLPEKTKVRRYYRRDNLEYWRPV